MKILMHSRWFWPHIGGIESLMDVFSQNFLDFGHDVVIVSDHPGPDLVPWSGLEVVRSPSGVHLFNLARRADVALVAGMTLRAVPIILAAGTPVVVTHQGWYGGNLGGNFSILKNFFNRAVTNISASHGVRKHIQAGSTVIPNPYDDQIFKGPQNAPPTSDIAFVGRLVSDKGADILISSLAVLRDRYGLRPTTKIVGDGVERAYLEKLTQELGLSESVTFLGYRTGQGLADELRSSRIMAAPARWEEPFGIVALEGAACGCIVVGTDGGGFPEAIGPSGYIAKRGDLESFVENLRLAIVNGAPNARYLVEAHLDKHRGRTIAKRYEAELLRVCRA